MNYYCIRVRGVNDDELELITDLCFEAGASGIEEGLAFAQPSLEYEAQVLKTKTHDIVVYFDEPPGEFVHELQEKFPQIEITLSKEAERDWLAEWKKGFQPFCLAGPYWVVPSWLPVPPEASRPLIIDPGMAFGTGTHATTQLCSRALVGVVRPGMSVADIGTGTGILAMVAHFQGAKRVLATDNDPEAIRVAKENLALNNIGHGPSPIELYEGSVGKRTETFDVVVANIIDGVLLRIRDELLSILGPAGTLVLGGILLEREPEFLEPFLADRPLKLVQRNVQDEWVSYTLLRL